MKLTEVTRSCSRKVNLGNYEVVDIFASFKAEVESEEEAKEASKALFKLAWTEVMSDAKKLKEAIK